MTTPQSRPPRASRGMPQFRFSSITVAVILLLLLIASSVLTSSNALHSLSAEAASATPQKPPAGIVDAPQMSHGCGKTPPVAPGTTGAGSLVSGGTARTYLVHPPRGYIPTQSYPLVLNFHGHANTAEHQELSTQFSVLADENQFIVAYPQGIIGPDLKTGWASGGPN